MPIDQAVQEVHKTLPPLRQCNRHNDCDQAEKERLERHPGTLCPYSFHCYNDDCEDCFGC